MPLRLPWNGNDYDTHADDLGAPLDHLDLRDVTLVSHSASSGEIVPARVRESAGRQRQDLKQPEQLRLGRGSFASEGPSGLRLRASQQIERCDMRDHQRGHIDDGNHIRGTQLPRYRQGEVGGAPRAQFRTTTSFGGSDGRDFNIRKRRPSRDTS